MKFINEDELKSMVMFNMTPLIDVVLLLIIFFMLTTTFIYQSGININPPHAKSSVPEVKRALVISITESGRIFIENKEVYPYDLEKELASYIQTHPELKTVIIKGDKDVKYGLVVRVMDACNSLNLKDLIISTTPEQD
ncbi:MAG TPA: biopolymer transporter ExbD [Firmicutes bacterium]|mgnify:CR=1 FL=1|nr:biopolymer transporter ExbD [Bacillota bacterium]